MDSRSSLSTLELPGRQRELARIRRELDRARAGETRFLALVGEAGVGKTRLLREVARSSGASDLVLGIHLPAARLVVEDLLEEWLTPVLRAAGRRAVASDIALAALAYPRLRELHPVAEAANAQQVPKGRAIAAVARLLAEAADRQPLLILIDDFPNLPPDVRRFVADLAIGLAGAPAGFLTTARLERSGPDPLRDRALAPLREQHLIERIDVGPLEREGLEELISDELDPGVVPSLLPWLAAKSGGNPLFAVELIRALEGQGVLFVDRESRSWRVAGPLSVLRLPETIAHVLDARRRALAPELSRALPILALLGADAPDVLLAQALDTEGPAVQELKQRLQRAGVLVRLGEGGPHEHDAFAHALMAEHWALELAPEERRRVAARARALLESVVTSRLGSLPGGERGSCATGFEQANEDELLRLWAYGMAGGEPEPAVRAAIELGRRRLRTHGPREAAIWARRAGAWLDRASGSGGAREDGKLDRERARWLRRQLDFLLGSAMEREGRLTAAEVRLRRFVASPEGADSGHGVYAISRLGLLLIKRGQPAEARAMFEHGIAVMTGATTAHAPLIRCDLLAYQAFIDSQEGAFEAADEHLAAAAACLEELRGDPRTIRSEVHLLHTCAALAGERGRLRQAIGDFERLIELEGESPERVQAEALQALAHYRMLVGDLETARALLDRALRIARRKHNLVTATACYGTSAMIETAAGNWGDALLLAERARRLAEATHHRASWFQAMAELGRIHEALGHRAASDRAFEEASIALEPAAPGENGDEPRYFQYTRAWVLCRRGDWAGARRACEDAMAVAVKRRNPLLPSEIDLLALEAAVRDAAAGGRRLCPPDFAPRMLAIENVMRGEMVRGGLVDLARVRLYAGLVSWDEADPSSVLTELGDHLEAMGAGARGREIAAELAATRLANQPECRAVLAALAGGDSLAGSGSRRADPAPALLPLEPDLPSDRLRITTFGRLAVARAGEVEPITRSTWGSRKARLLLAYFLAADPESRGVTREALCTAVWPDSDSLHLERTFRVTMSFLRRALRSGEPEEASGSEVGGGETPSPGARLLWFRDGRYRLAREELWCDALAFDRLAGGAVASERGGDPGAALQKRRAAFELYQGEFLADFDEPWIEPRRERYRRQFVQIGTALFDAALGAGRLEEAEEVGERIVACDPLAEEGHQILIRAYLAGGRRDAAVRQLERCRTLLRTELGIDVSPRTAKLLSSEHPGR